MGTRDPRHTATPLRLLPLDVLHSFVPVGFHPRNTVCPVCREHLDGRGLSCERCQLGMHDRCYLTRIAAGDELLWLTRRDDVTAGPARVFLCPVCRS